MEEATTRGPTSPTTVPLTTPPPPSLSHFITLSEMPVGLAKQLFIDGKGKPMSALGQACSTKAFLVDGSQCPPIVAEALFRRV